MRFQIPQFIDVEDKIFGPLTFRQFIYLAGGAGLIFVLWRALPSLIALLFITPVAGLSLALAFYKINNRPFIDALEAGLKYIIGKRLYTWQKKDSPIKRAETESTEPESGIFVPKLSESKLKDIAWSLDVQESIYAGQDKEREERK